MINDKIIKSQLVRNFLHSDEWGEVYNNLKSNIAGQWEIEQDASKREVLWHRLQALAAIQTELMSLASEAYINDMKTQAKG